jgi:Rieske Fe-S protein
MGSVILNSPVLDNRAVVRQSSPLSSTQSPEGIMARCEVCGNDYYLSFEVITAGRRHVFDSFECAIQKLAPVCSHCGCKVIGHGVEANGTFYCCAHCARNEGAMTVADRAL